MSQELRTLSLPLLPLRNSVAFPNTVMPLAIGRESTRAAVDAALQGESKEMLIVAQRDASNENPGLYDLYSVGIRASIRRAARSENSIELIVVGQERVRLLDIIHTQPYLQAVGQIVPLPSDGGADVDALRRSVQELAAKLLSVAGHSAQASHLPQTDDPLQLVFVLGSLLDIDVEKKQAMLECESRLDALTRLGEYLSHEIQVLELRNKIASETATELNKEQKEHILRQQLRAIQQELGEEQEDVAELRETLQKADLADDVRREAERELTRLSRINRASPEYALTRNYLELIAELPWRKSTQDSRDIAQARNVLDEDHYGLREVKQRILEHLAVMKNNPRARAPILCFVGPPGVGKTSLGQSIARALGRKFERARLGGVHDESKLRGHRRTYIGAMPGRLIQAMRRAQANNPVLMLDEVDKLGRGSAHGDPAAALLEILDPAQNHTFRDNYLDLPFDLSNVFFIATANTLEGVPRALVDRMEVLRLSGYSEEEKVDIARRYLLPRQLGESGLTADQLEIPDGTMKDIIARYTQEAGVRQLERTLARVARKITLRLVEGPSSTRMVLGVADLSEILGPERHHPQLGRTRLDPGVSAGLAWTEAGGEVLYVEAMRVPRSRGIKLTGQLGDVMRESAYAARSYVLSHATQLGLGAAVPDGGLHVHVPTGAVPKDGPSAGVAITVALASAYAGLAARSDTAMTGEVTLTGLVLPVGGIKEKVMAARRLGMKRVLLPRGNAPDLQDVPATVRDALEVVLVERVEEVLREAIPDLNVHPATGEQAA